ncbi:glycosyltransferase family 4 protein, partial [Candidatus Uhrbacteria bacterium]|nr:glycosyltransferase family 4 protein [Candidatus Uhrbacteria bacterium]
MRVVHIGQKSFVMGERGGGVEKHVAELASRLVRLGNDVTVYARPRYTVEHPRYKDGVRIRYIPTLNTKHLEAIVHVFLSTVDALFRRVDVFHYQGVGPALLCWIPRLVCPRATVIVTFHAQDRYHQKWGWIARRILHFGEWMSCNIPHATITVSHVLQVLCRDVYHVETIFIPNGAVTEQVTSTAHIFREGLKKQGYVLYVGRLMPVKGVHHLLRAFRGVETDKALVIIGAPSTGEEKYLEFLTRLAQGDSRIRMLGFRAPQEITEFYAHSYLYCQPSESEGMPLAVIEAMGQGVAVLASDIPGNLEAIHYAGFTFENKNEDDLRVQLQ